MPQSSRSNKIFPGHGIGIESANDDQRTSKGHDTNPTGGAYAEGKKNAHDNNDTKDQRSIANRLAAAEQQNAEAKKYDSKQTHDPTAPAVMHGNEPSQGAKVDKVLQEEDEEMLRKKGAA